MKDQQILYIDINFFNFYKRFSRFLFFKKYKITFLFYNIFLLKRFYKLSFLNILLKYSLLINFCKISQNLLKVYKNLILENFRFLDEGSYNVFKKVIYFNIFTKNLYFITPETLKHQNSILIKSSTFSYFNYFYKNYK